MGICTGKLASRNREHETVPQRSAPQYRIVASSSDPRLHSNQPPASTLQSAASASPRSAALPISRSSPSLAISSSLSHSPGTPSPDIVRAASRAYLERFASSSPRRQSGLERASSTPSAGPSHNRHPKGCKCSICQPDLYEAHDRRLVKMSAVTGSFKEQCVAHCHCFRCSERRKHAILTWYAQ
jgi:hypothetical protein